MSAFFIPEGQTEDELLLSEAKKFADLGMISYVLPTEPLGEEWVIGYEGNLLKFTPEEFRAFMNGAGIAIRFIAQQQGVPG